jgi:hypothetical protein
MIGVGTRLMMKDMCGQGASISGIAREQAVRSEETEERLDGCGLAAAGHTRQPARRYEARRSVSLGT